MSKKLDESAIASELSGSAFFRGPITPPPAPTKPKRQVTRKATRTATTPQRTVDEVPASRINAPSNPTVSTNVSTPARTTVRPNGRRILTRYAFEFFQDQIETFKRWSLEQQFRGEKGSMSQMVREAMDAYIAHKMNSEAEGTEDGTDARTTVRPDGGGDR